MELHPLANFKGVGLAVVGRLWHVAKAEVADEVGRVGRIVRVDLDQQAIERCYRVNNAEG